MEAKEGKLSCSLDGGYRSIDNHYCNDERVKYAHNMFSGSWKRTQTDTANAGFREARLSGRLLQAGIDYGILGLLGVLSIVSLALAGERWWLYRTIEVEAFSDRLSLEKTLTSYLHLIASIGSNAPYIGLLGTVLGIMLTFYTMGTGGFMNAPKIMAGIAPALKATAAGLLVAIPSVAVYNLLLRKVKVLLMDWEIEDGRKKL